MICDLCGVQGRAQDFNEGGSRPGSRIPENRFKRSMFIPESRIFRNIRVPSSHIIIIQLSNVCRLSPSSVDLRHVNHAESHLFSLRTHCADIATSVQRVLRNLSFYTACTKKGLEIDFLFISSPFDVSFAAFTPAVEEKLCKLFYFLFQVATCPCGEN